jgi:DNA-binding NtrC family response regulator
MLSILFAEDDPAVRIPVGGALRQLGYEVAVARDGAEALDQLEQRAFDVVVTDVRMPKVDGLTLLKRVRARSPTTAVVLVTAFGSIHEAVECMKDQAVDYMSKPFEVEQLGKLLQRVAERRRLEHELRSAREHLAAMRGERVLVGRSPSARRLIELCEVVARAGSAVLVTGESGTGKELVARLLHDQSLRKKGPFVAINCAAFPDTLLEEELFGHERGAFTGALRSREGRFKAADGGTLFLDEIGEMTPGAQAKLLRVLQEGAFEPIGTNRTVEVDVRVVSATNRDLKQRISEGRFREDLYFRLKVLELRVPPLRERAGDVTVLAEHFLARHVAPGVAPPPVSADAWRTLHRYAWPGNVRELEHAIEHAVVLARGGEIRVEHLPTDLHGADATSTAAAAASASAPASASASAAASASAPASAAARAPTPADAGVQPLADAMREFEREHLQTALRAVRGNRSRAAALLGISRKSLWQKLRGYGLNDKERA